MGFKKWFGASAKPAAIAQAQADTDKAEVKQQEQQRQDYSRESRNNIDKAFNDQFTPDFYDRYVKDYTGYYNPQLDKKFAKTKQQLAYGLARQNLDTSTVGVQKMQEADDELAAKKLQVAGEATDATNKLKTNVENQRTGLYNLSENSSDPSAALNRATAEATTLAAAPQYSELGDVFAGLLSSFGSLMSGVNSNPNAAAYGSNYGYGKSPPVSGAGSSRVGRG